MANFKLKDSGEWAVLADVPEKIERAVKEYQKETWAIQANTRRTPQAWGADLDRLRGAFVKIGLGTGWHQQDVPSALLTA